LFYGVGISGGWGFLLIMLRGDTLHVI